MSNPTIENAAPAEPVALAIEIDSSLLRIGDLRLFLRLASLKNAPAAEQQAALIDALPVFDRLVVGGIDAYPLSQLPQALEAVADAISKAGNPGN